MKESKIIRSKRERNFTILNNDIFQQGMSLQAIGLLTYLLSKPDDWTVQKKSLSRNFKNGRDGTNTAFNELVEFGYIEVIQNREGGKFKSVDYRVFDEPSPQTGNQETVQKNSPQTGKPETAKPYTEKPETENPSLLSTIETKDGVNKEPSVNSSELTGQLFPEVKIPQTESSKRKEKSSGQKEKKVSTHSMMMEVYWNWYKGMNNGIEPCITAADGMAMSHLVKHFTKIVQYRGKTEEETPVECVKILQFIFENWGDLRPFEQSQVAIRQINSNITNIINQIKNGKKAKSAQHTAEQTRRAFDNFDKAFANGNK